MLFTEHTQSSSVRRGLPRPIGSSRQAVSTSKVWSNPDDRNGTVGNWIKTGPFIIFVRVSLGNFKNNYNQPKVIFPLFFFRFFRSGNMLGPQAALRADRSLDSKHSRMIQITDSVIRLQYRADIFGAAFLTPDRSWPIAGRQRQPRFPISCSV